MDKSDLTAVFQLLFPYQGKGPCNVRAMVESFASAKNPKPLDDFLAAQVVGAQNSGNEKLAKKLQDVGIVKKQR